jgi:serine phosphatase RsbU (regulator of sigma subunit)
MKPAGLASFRQGLAASIVTMLLITCVAPLTLFAAFFMVTSYNQETSARQIAHGETAERMAVVITTKLESAFGAIDEFWNAVTYERLDPAQLEKTAIGLMQRNPFYDSVTMADAAGNEIVKLSRYYTYTRSEYGSIANSEGFHSATRGAMHVGEIGFSQFNNFPIIQVTKRIVRADGSTIGVCRIGINVSSFWKSVTSADAKVRERYAYVVDGAGTVIASADVANVLGKKSMRTTPAVDMLLQGKSGIATYVGLNGQKDIGAAVPIPVTRWGVIVEEPVSVVYRGIAIYSTVFFLLLIASVLIVAFVGYRFSMKRIVQPVRLLEEKAHEVASGDLHASFPEVSTGEIHSLGTAFNHMVSELRDLTENLDGMVKQRTLELDNSLRELELANGQIVESIQYARTIQKAILPQMSEISDHLRDYFVIWNPKDIIGGDIYWFTGDQEGFLVSVIDCTGHSVPGAIMTMIAGTTLNRVVSEIGFSDPAKILERMDFIVRQTLSQHRENSESNDGLDMALCFIRKDGSVVFSGARLSLYVLGPAETREIRGSRRSIGYKSPTKKDGFVNHEIRSDSGLCFYMATDGLYDQVGGKRHLPFGKTRLLGLLASVRDLPMTKQRDALLASFETYRRHEVQRDDITAFGFRLDGCGE